jgi:hypothetical protein
VVAWLVVEPVVVAVTEEPVVELPGRMEWEVVEPVVVVRTDEVAVLVLLAVVVAVAEAVVLLVVLPATGTAWKVMRTPSQPSPEGPTVSTSRLLVSRQKSLCARKMPPLESCNQVSTVGAGLEATRKAVAFSSVGEEPRNSRP